MKTETKKTMIIAAVVDVNNLTLYKEDGSTIIIPQGDPRVRRIVGEVTPQLLEQGWAEVEIGIPGGNQYAKFEEESSGVVKFFRVAKEKIKHLFIDEPQPVVDTRPVPALSIGPVPVAVPAPVTIPPPLAAVIETLPSLGLANPNEVVLAMDPAQPGADQTVETIVSLTPATDHINTAGIYDVSEADEVEAAMEQASLPVPATETKVKQTIAAVDEIMKHAIPVSSVEFHEEGVAKQGNVVEENGYTDRQKNEVDENPDTIIAVVDGKIIPGMEKIKTQFGRAAKLGSTLGVENFLRRLAAVIEHRSHSVEDLLKFMERGDLPIADDGSILIYKVLKRKGDKTEGKYVDCHTKNVEQWTGAYVCMDEKLVDPNRRNECSNGLHVARRGYISGFSGDVCVLAKLAPEDVIAVPAYDANKMRVCGYHILIELSDKQYQLLRFNKPLTDDPEGKVLLANAIAGKHIHKTHEVRITQQNGGGVKVTKLSKEVFTKPKGDTPEIKFDEPAKVAPVIVEAEAIGNPDKEHIDLPVNVLDVVKQVEEVKQQSSRKETAQKLYNNWLGAPNDQKAAPLAELLAFKKASKKSWDALGIPDPTANKHNLPVPTVTPPIPYVAKPKAKAKKPTPPGEWKNPKLRSAPKLKPVPQVHAVDFGDEPADRAGGPTNVLDTSVGEGSPRERIAKLMSIGLTSVGVAQAVLTLKKKSKKSWDILGVTPEQVEQILKLAGNGD